MNYKQTLITLNKFSNFFEYLMLQYVPINKLLLHILYIIYVIVNISYMQEKEKYTIIHSIKNSEITECNECF